MVQGEQNSRLQEQSRQILNQVGILLRQGKFDPGGKILGEACTKADSR